jgi:3-hydroxymyristoyl/3-hydroxydecanoyl-(acyl carrier protein) dehydratase
MTAEKDLSTFVDRIPHRPPVRLVERFLRADTVSAEAALVVREGSWLRHGALAPEALVEALAQTCALQAVANATEGVKLEGALAAVSRFRFSSRAEPGDEVRLAVTLQTRLGPLAAFEGVARVGEREVARGELRVVGR